METIEEYEKSLDGYIPHYKESYQDGAQSRQAEINELQKRIKKTEKLMRLFFKEDSYEYAISAHDILKGEER